MPIPKYVIPYLMFKHFFLHSKPWMLVLVGMQLVTCLIVGNALTYICLYLQIGLCVVSAFRVPATRFGVQTIRMVLWPRTLHWAYGQICKAVLADMQQKGKIMLP